jgi:hypothetical protein
VSHGGFTGIARGRACPASVVGSAGYRARVKCNGGKEACTALTLVQE